MIPGCGRNIHSPIEVPVTLVLIELESKGLTHCGKDSGRGVVEARLSDNLNISRFIPMEIGILLNGG
jgi:hypothetical protein